MTAHNHPLTEVVYNTLIEEKKITMVLFSPIIIAHLELLVERE